MSDFKLSNRRKTREFLLMFFYSKEIENYNFSEIEPNIYDHFKAVNALLEEDDYEIVREHILDIFNSVKITKLEKYSLVEFKLPGTGKDHSMEFGEMDRENIKDGFLSYSFKLTDSKMDKAHIDIPKGKKENDESGNLRFFKQYFEYYEKNIDEIDSFIDKKLENWDFSRISIIDKLIIRMGIVEFIYFPEIPEKVVINEAIELGKKYSSEKSNVFINGILNKFKNELRLDKK
ncbi:MAG: transcription antitermination factor NusB [Candidatus Delongbacteria bacterium]|nr:transcription antitermination factor NusB [Candidatus Delongbacteria bacterium]